MEHSLAFRLDRERVRLVLMQGERELLRASLPPPARFRSGRPAKALLESLALRLDTGLRVVLSAAAPAEGWSLELTDELGIGCRTLFYDVAGLERHARRRRLGGAGDLRDLHHLLVLARLAGEASGRGASRR